MNNTPSNHQDNKTILKTGIDIVDIFRFNETLQKWGDKFILRVFTQKEIEYCKRKAKPYMHFAGRFAAKEAVIKILKTHKSPSLKSIEILRTKEGEPTVNLKDDTLAASAAMGINHISLSISHTESFAAAFAAALITTCPGKS